jgi:hypothetical protein
MVVTIFYGATAVAIVPYAPMERRVLLVPATMIATV